MEHRIRPTALIFRGEQLLLIEYLEDGKLHYNFPGGGLESGETLHEGVKREALEEANVNVDVGPVAFIYEFNPRKQNGDYDSNARPSISIFFECTLKEGEEPTLPKNPDPMQSGVRWVTLNELKDVVIYPNMKNLVINYFYNRRSIELIENDMLESYIANSAAPCINR